MKYDKPIRRTDEQLFALLKLRAVQE